MTDLQFPMEGLSWHQISMVIIRVNLEGNSPGQIQEFVLG